MKLKVKPSMREKKRYVVFNVYSNDKILYEDLKNAIKNVIIKWIGEMGFGSANIRFIDNLWDERRLTGFISCSPKYVWSVRFALSLLQHVGDADVIIHVPVVSGTIKSAKEKIMSKMAWK